MNNFEKIKAMDIDEMAEFIDTISLCCEKACANPHCTGNQNLCLEHIKKWLESEVRE